MPLRRVTALLCAAALLGVYLCAGGLLRLHEVLSPFAAPPTSAATSPAARSQAQPPLPPLYDRLVIVLIDALRADMVLGSAALYRDAAPPVVGELNVHMAYARGLVESGEALGFVAHASVPTVTMPRLKALVTGKAPAFIDILKNFNSAALAEENLVGLLGASGRRIVFYGDDTWLKLFPAAFARADGTSGFFTRDTVEVDANVTRHLEDELDPAMQSPQSRDWDVLVLHYLGLDHVGHLRGPRSALMADKLREMDAVVQRVHESVKAQDARRRARDASALPSLVLLCSDHGMSEVGNHGGATVEESSALLLFLRGDGRRLDVTERAYQQRRIQVDLVPTIASVLGVHIPPFSTGLLIDEVVQASSAADSRSRPSRHYVHSLHRNFEQLHRLAVVKFHAASLADFDAEYAAKLAAIRQFIAGGTADAVDVESVRALRAACAVLQDKLAQSDGSEYNGRAVALGLSVLFAGVGVAVHQLRERGVRLVGVSSLSDPVEAVLLLGSVLQIASLSSSSSIENEHATAFYLLTTVLFVLLCTRVLRSRNQVINFGRLNGLDVDAQAAGNAFANDDSLSILSTGPLFNGAVPPEAFFVLIYALVVSRTTRSLAKGRVALAFALASFTVGMLCSLLCCRLARDLGGAAAQENTTLVSDDTAPMLSTATADDFARAVYAVACVLAVLLAASRHARAKIAEMALWLLVTLLQRESNLPTLGVLCLQLACVQQLLAREPRLVRSGVALALLALWLAQCAFFALGNSHLVTTIDLSQSFHGLRGYTQWIVGVLTFVSVMSGPLVVFASLLQWLQFPSVAMSRGSDSSDPDSATTATTRQAFDAPVAALALFVYQTLRFAVYTIVVYFMRFHLFIWSVFAPKMLYEVVQTAVVLVVALAVSSGYHSKDNEDTQVRSNREREH
ncbi:hypothetical protein PybrP1_009349 [[Pythium] brassicae (nom. inval.)]|nr:hypothetical protein PybrP1_009349 [[Pythium] brassicae (nom. inval.)]